MHHVGMYTFQHIALFAVTIIVISLAVKFTKIKEKQNVKKIVRILTIIIWILEIFKTIYVFKMGDGGNLNKSVPLYYCSLLLYTGLLSSFGKGKIQRIGDVFLSTGGIVAGIVFIIFPTTSLPEYPVWHFISLHSFLYHGVMIYIGVIMNKFNYIELNKKDIIYYAGLITIICILAYIINIQYGSNLMFISRDFPGTPLEFIYKHTGKFFPIFMSAVQITLPFYVVYGIKTLVGKNKKKLLNEAAVV